MQSHIGGVSDMHSEQKKNWEIDEYVSISCFKENHFGESNIVVYFWREP
jgi:hypothetical protein